MASLHVENYFVGPLEFLRQQRATMPITGLACVRWSGRRSAMAVPLLRACATIFSFLMLQCPTGTSDSVMTHACPLGAMVTRR